MLFLGQCFDIVGWVIWPIKLFPNVTYNVFDRILNLAQLIWSFSYGGQFDKRIYKNPESCVPLGMWHVTVSKMMEVRW